MVIADLENSNTPSDNPGTHREREVCWVLSNNRR